MSTTTQNNQKQKNKQQNIITVNKWDLTDEEFANFGDRFPPGFQKLKLLGKGGFAIVWLGQNMKTQEKYAIKQILTSNTHQTHIKEIWFGKYFFTNGVEKEKYQTYKGIKNICRMIKYDIKSFDTWVFYELCGQSLGSALYEIKYQGQKKDEKIYRMHYTKFYYSLRKDIKQIKKIIFEIAQALWLLSDQRIVHSDVKTENILIQISPNQQITQVKLIDFGSAFTFGNLKYFCMATPEYMAPEILNFILYQNQQNFVPQLLDYIKNYKKTYVIDVWSLGCVILEMINGIPLWMSLKAIVNYKGVDIIRRGLFATKGRVFQKIIDKQIYVSENLVNILTEENYSGIEVDQDLVFLMQKMLSLDPEQRISPKEICQFLENKI